MIKEVRNELRDIMSSTKRIRSIPPGLKYADGVRLISRNADQIIIPNPIVKTGVDTDEIKLLERWIDHFVKKKVHFDVKFHLGCSNKHSKNVIIWAERFVEYSK